MVAIVSFIIALGLSVILLGFLNHITARDLSVGQLLNAPFLAVIFLTVVLIGFMAGSGPAAMLANVKADHVIKGHVAVLKRNRIRNGLIVFQFAACISLMICTKVVYDQLTVLMDSNPGFNKNQVLVINIPADYTSHEQVSGFRNEINSLPFVQNVSLVGYNSLPTSSIDIDGYEVAFNGETVTRLFRNITVDERFTDLLEIDVVEGRALLPGDLENNTGAVLVNESLVSGMGWTEPLGEVLFFGTEEYEVVGVVRDFNFSSLHHPIEPTIIHGSAGYPEKIMVKVNAMSFRHMRDLELAWKKHFSGMAFQVEFLDTYFQAQYRNEETTKNVLMYFAVFTIIIAGLGLLGLVAISTFQKTKEIGIRKVLGAGFFQIAILVVKEFIILVIVGGLISIPVSWWSMREWLHNFSYKTTFDIGDFLVPLVASIVIALLAMSYHTISITRKNPSESINRNGL
jgi:putative ABC transport system permease protein